MGGEVQRSILIVSGTKAGALAVRALLPEDSPYAVTFAQGETSACAQLQKHFDFVLVDAPLSDAFGDSLALQVAGRGASGAILFAENAASPEALRAEAGGVLVLEKPVDRVLLQKALHLLTAMQNRWYRLNSENKKLQTQMEEIRVVSRAKYILMEYLRMSEQQAHRYIEKQAMDMRTSKRSIAESILKTYD